MSSCAPPFSPPAPSGRSAKGFLSQAVFSLPAVGSFERSRSSYVPLPPLPALLSSSPYGDLESSATCPLKPPFPCVARPPPRLLLRHGTTFRDTSFTSPHKGFHAAVGPFRLAVDPFRSVFRPPSSSLLQSSTPSSFPLPSSSSIALFLPLSFVLSLPVL